MPDRTRTVTKSVTRRLRQNGQCPSIRLERAFWRILDRIAWREGISTPAFISKLHSEDLELHGETPNFTSLRRCACTIHLGEYERDAVARFAAAPDAAWVLEASVITDHQMATLLQMARDIYPHDRVDDRFYAIAVKGYDAEDKTALVDEGVAGASENPTLTIVALAIRHVDHITSEMVAGTI